MSVEESTNSRVFSLIAGSQELAEFRGLLCCSKDKIHEAVYTVLMGKSFFSVILAV